MLNKQEIYISTDIETDGPIPSENSMLSFGSVALLPDKTILGTFSRNLGLLPGATPDSDTMNWWKTQPEAWAAHRKDLVNPKDAMVDYVAWLKSLPGTPVFVGYPAGFDFTWIYWYLIKFAGESPFSYSALDLESFAMAILLTPFKETDKNFPKEWFEPLPHTHVALDDALEQGLMFCNILEYSQRMCNNPEC